jgi:cytochrome P450
MYVIIIIMKDIPTFFTNKQEIIDYDYSFEDFINDNNINEYEYLHNLSIPLLVDHGLTETKLCESYFKSIMFGHNHIFIQKLIDNIGSLTNISLPLLHKWNDEIKINNLLIISHPDDAERICKKHIKKAPIFKTLLDTSIISTTDNDDWKDQRQSMNIAFIPKLSLQKIFPLSRERARFCATLLKEKSNDYLQSVDMSDFFLNETQAQLQLGMFGFSNEFQEKTNKLVRDSFSGIHSEYLEQFSKEAYEEIQISNGPLSKVIDSDDMKKNIGNILIFAFAGHDTTGHTLSWLLYELCKHPDYKQTLINEIDQYWLNHKEETYGSFNELPFMTKCITETLRLWPALANGTYRELETDEEIYGLDKQKVKVKKGTWCQIINWTRHRSKELWGEDVNIFNPYRNFKDSEIWDYQGFGTTHVSSERYSPFIYGPRHCIGKNFSQMEMRLILLHLFKDHDFQLNGKQLQTVNDKKYMGMNTFTLGPGSIYDGYLGMYVNIFPRLKSKL